MIGTKAYNLVWDLREDLKTNQSAPAFLADEFWSWVIDDIDMKNVKLSDDIDNERLAESARIIIHRIEDKVVKLNNRISGLEASLYRHCEDTPDEMCWEVRLIEGLNRKKWEYKCDQFALHQAIKEFKKG